MTEQIHLYSPKDVAKVRELLYNEQGGKDALTGLPLDYKQSVTDHSHKTQFVRGVLHRQCNAVLGKIENLWVRYLSYWFEGTLSEFLRKAADYIERKDDERYIHPGWLRKSQTLFNSLPEGDKKAILEALEQNQGGNSTERKKLFKTALNTKQFTFEYIKNLINERKKA